MSRQMQNSETDTTGIIVVPLLVFALLAIIWYSAGPTLYYGSAKMAYWMLWPLDLIGAVHEYRQQIITDVVQLPSVGKFVEWTGNAWRVPAFFVALIAFNLARRAWSHPIGKETGGLRGRLSVDALLRYQAQIHSPIAPIVPIAKDMHKNEDQRFHEPWHPHEVVERFGLANKDGDLDKEKGELYLVSQLGTRIFRPGIDKSDSVFADRLNDWEKAIFALLAPPAINGKAGLDEYRKLLDKLNYSAVNATQTPDLSLANDMYQKYRDHPQLNNLWRSHHFSVTYLMQIYKLSKRAGKVTTADFLGWLRPNANGLYAALNSVGRQRTAFTECAGAHEHWEHEQKCQRLGRVSILPVVVSALQSLEDEYIFWRGANAGETLETMWGKMTQDQARIDTDLFRQHVVDMLEPHMSAPPKPGSETEFDVAEAAARRDHQDKQMSNIMSGAKSAFQKDEESQS
jgi:hypothetical protein